MTKLPDKIADATAFFDGVMARHNWTLDDLAKFSGYSRRTLQKAMKAGSGVSLTGKMREKIDNASSLARLRTAPRRSEPLVPDPGIAAEDEGIYAANPELRLMSEMAEILSDMMRSSPVSRRVLVDRLVESAIELKEKLNPK